MWNVNVIHSNHVTVMRGLEVTFYAILGALLVGQIFLGEGAVRLSEALLTLGGEVLLSLVATGSAPLVSLLSAEAVAEQKRGRVIPIRLGRAARRGCEDRRSAA